jgi:GTP-binding protein
MLADRARIEVQAGRGGDGSLSFRRESRVPKGGPDGGDGGRGGDVALRCDDSLRDLQSFRRRGRYAAERGGHGLGSLCHGANGERLVVGVPPGTTVERWDGRRYDLVRPGQEVTIALGGPGGRGNKTFATATRQAPRLAERGLPGEEGIVELHLKLLADVGLVGLPNAGKSSLLSRMTRAQPKVAAYPFTTLTPVLGTIDAEDRQLVLADIPGLIEGASGGAGLGHDFLAHVERTRLLVHVLDLAPLDGSDPVRNFEVIERELAEHDPRLASLPRLLALSKADLVTPEVAQAALAEWSERVAFPVLVTSSATGQGLPELRGELLERVPVAPPEPAGSGEDDVAEFAVFRPAKSQAFEITRGPDGTWIVTGESVERLFARWDLENEEAQALVEARLRRMGVIGALEKAGFEPGDDVEIAGSVFELDPSF